MKLTTEEINKRMIELRNLRKLHAAARERILVLETENKTLKARVKELEQRDRENNQRITDLSLQMEELRTMVFGKKKTQKDRDDGTDSGTPPKTVRTKGSYQRPIPKEEEVTHHVHHPLKHSHHTTRVRIKTYYVEDIPKPQKTVTKHTVAQQYCTTCKKWISDLTVPPGTVVLGERVKRYIAYLHTIGRLSYRQIRESLSITYDLSVSDGEITNILKQQAIQERPTYEQLKVSIRNEPSVHLDESPWHLQRGDGYRRYGWGVVGGDSGDAVFTLGKTRGKGNATDLLGDTNAVVVSDDYGAYRSIDQPHQLCCAHIHRKLRDLKESTVLSGTLQSHCMKAYRTFAAIYSDIAKNKDYHDLCARLRAFVAPHTSDPTKLTRIKTQVARQLTNYLTCLQYPRVAPDNNAAERALRHVVLKRKVSFGSFSEETAERTAILLSVLMTKRNHGELREWVVGAGV